MTIHAGEKAARLRRATASPSTSLISSPLSPLHHAKNANDSLLSPPVTPLADTDILGALDKSTISSRSTTIPSFRSRRSPGNTKSPIQYSTSTSKEVHQPSSSSLLQDITGHFVFSGVDLPQSQTAGIAALDWDKFNEPRTTIANDNYSYPTTVFFIEQPPKDSSMNIAPQEEIDLPLDESQSPSSETKSSPRRFLPWIFAFSTSPSASREAKHSEEMDSMTSPADLPEQDNSGECSTTAKTKKPNKRKKRKSKGKAKAVLATDVNTEDMIISTSELKSSVPIQSPVLANDELESKTVTSATQHPLTSDSSADSKVTERHSNPEDIKALPTLKIGKDVKHVDEGINNHLATAAFNSSSCLSLDNGFEPVPVRRSARRSHRKGAKEVQTKDSTAVHLSKVETARQKGLPIDKQYTEVIGHARKVSRTDTETSFHTALHLASRTPSPTLQEQDDVIDESLAIFDVTPQSDLEDDNDNNLASSSMSTRTEGSLIISTIAAKTSMQSSFVDDLAIQNEPMKVEDQEDTYKVEQAAQIDLSLKPSDETSTDHLRPSLLKASNQSMQMSNVSPVKVIEETESNRLQRTLDWRLISAGYQGTQQDTLLSPPKLKVQIPIDNLSPSRRESQQSALSATSTASRSQLAFNLLRHQQRRLNYSWVQLLPSFEELHPHRSIGREAQLRKMAWLGLEEYVTRRVKTATINGIKETIVWITHLCPSRSNALHRSKVSSMEPLLTSSSIWLRAVSKRTSNTFRTGTRLMEDAVRAYQTRLIQERVQESGNVSPAHSGFETAKGNPLEWPVPLLSLLPLSPTQVPHNIPYRTEVSQQDQMSQSDSSDSSSIDRQGSLELQRIVESCMYELRNSTLTPSANNAWLQTLDGVEQTEKDAIVAFFHNSNLEWHTFMSDSMVGVDGPQISVDTWPCNELAAWPTTPYASLSTYPGLTPVVAKEERASLDNGLSSGEMAEIEDAMFQDYLHQSNQSTCANTRNSRRNNRNASYGRAGNTSQGGRSRAPSSSGHASIGIGGAEGRARNAASLTPTRTRSQEGRHSNTSIMERRAPIPRLDFVSPNDTRPFFIRPESDRDNPFRCTIQQQQQRQQLQRDTQEKENEQPVSLETLTQIHQKQYEIWAKETENEAVRHSLANLQQHLSLAAEQKQVQSDTFEYDSSLHSTYPHSQVRQLQRQEKDEVLISSLGHPQSTIYNSHQVQGDYRSWPMQLDSPLSTASNLSSSLLFQTQLQRQQQMSQEARQLEQRHLDSFAHSMDQSALHCNYAYTEAHADRYKDIAQLHAAMASELIGHYDFGSALYREGLNQIAKPPRITLTEPSNRIHLSNESAQIFQEALTRQAQLQWHASLANAAANSQTTSTSTRDQQADMRSTTNAARRSSVQSIRTLPMESEQLHQYSDAIQTTSFYRRDSANSLKAKKGTPKRRSKQREGSLQGTIEATEPQVVQSASKLNTIPTGPKQTGQQQSTSMSARSNPPSGPNLNRKQRR